MTHRAHRHYVVLPLLLLVTVCSTIAGTRGVQRASSDLIADNALLPLASGGSIDIDPGSIWVSDERGGELKSGAVLVHSSAPVIAYVNTLRITMLGGAVFLSKDASSVTVAAISAPVLVQDGETFIAVPAGMQWKTGKEHLPTLKVGIPAWLAARRVSPLPGRFLSEQQRRAMELPSATLLPEAHDGPVPSSEAFLDAGQLPQAAARSMEERRKSVLGILRFAIEHDDVKAVQNLLLRHDLGDIWESQSARDVIAALLFTSPRSVALQQLLLPAVASDPDLLLLSSLLSITDTVSWTLPTDAFGMERLAARALAFPFGDTGTDAGRELPLQRWGEDIHVLLETETYSPQALKSVIGIFGPLAILREQQGYPERARLLAKILLEHGKKVQGELDREADGILASLRKLDTVDIHTMSEPASSVVDSASASSSSALGAGVEFDRRETERQARSALLQAGAIISLETRIVPESADIARIENIVFGGTDRDRTVSFDLNLHRGLAAHIIDGTDEYPYAMPWGDFVRWMQR